MQNSQLPAETMTRLLDQLTKKSQPNCPPTTTILPDKQLLDICKSAQDIFANQPVLLQLASPIKICGDIQGQLKQLLRIFELGLPPPKSNYLFLGNYLGRGGQAISVLCVLFLYKIRYPENVFLLRGNLESPAQNRFYDFYDECKREHSLELWKVFNEVFDMMPVAAVVEDKIFCVHGGLSPELGKVEDIYKLERPLSVPNKGLLCDLLWSDPCRSAKGFLPSQRGISVKFGRDTVQKFLKENQLDLIVRGHQLTQAGFEFEFGKQLLTLFSAAKFANEYENSGAFLIVDENLKCTLQILLPGERRSN